MHVVFFLLAMAGIIMGAQYIGETYGPYRNHLLAITLLYFSIWGISRVFTPKTTEKNSSRLSQSSVAKYVEKLASTSFFTALALYVAAITTLFGTTLLFADRALSAVMVVALGFGVALGLSLTAESKNQFIGIQPALPDSNGQSPQGHHPPLCPFCKKELRTSRAKQCFHCHKDWHDAQGEEH